MSIIKDKQDNPSWQIETYGQGGSGGSEGTDGTYGGSGGAGGNGCVIIVNNGEPNRNGQVYVGQAFAKQFASFKETNMHYSHGDDLFNKVFDRLDDTITKPFDAIDGIFDGLDEMFDGLESIFDGEDIRIPKGQDLSGNGNHWTSNFTSPVEKKPNFILEFTKNTWNKVWGKIVEIFDYYMRNKEESDKDDLAK